ncbi:hypothetical protein C5167_026107 [Papaver somniferum]|nr:hypothetical protein C5167_026107 [Papaver somniferum]
MFLISTIAAAKSKVVDEKGSHTDYVFGLDPNKNLKQASKFRGGGNVVVGGGGWRHTDLHHPHDNYYAIENNHPTSNIHNPGDVKGLIFMMNSALRNVQFQLVEAVVLVTLPVNISSGGSSSIGSDRETESDGGVCQKKKVMVVNDAACCDIAKDEKGKRRHQHLLLV